MIDSVIIDFNKEFLYKDEILFRLNKLNENKIIKCIENNSIKFFVFTIPISLKSIFDEKKLNKTIKKFVRFLKNKDIENIILSYSAKKISNIENILQEYFYIFNGKKVINFCFSNIIKKYINKEKRDNIEIIFLANNIDSFYYYFKKLFHSYRISGVITENINDFKEIANIFYEEYGFLLNIFEKDSFVDNENYFIINIDTSFFINKSDIDLNKINVIFNRCEKLLFLYNYFESINENVLEYAIYVSFRSLDKSNITEFFNKFDIRVVKINKKWLTFCNFFNIIR